MITQITNQLAIVNANQPIATGGSSQGATDARDLALTVRQTVIARVRGHYISASDDTDQNAELARIGLQARRDKGQAQAQEPPGVPGTATYDAAAKTLSVPAMPEHGTSIAAYRQPAGGTAVLAGTSLTTTVAVDDIGPLTPGITYQFWVTGHNSRGYGPESNHVTATA